MRAPDRLWLAAAAAAPPAVAGAALLVLASTHEQNVALTLAGGLFVGISFVGSGLVAWWRRPDNATGRLLALVGFTFLAGALADANDPLLFSVGQVVGAIPLAVLVHLVLAYPSGTLATRAERRLAAAGYALALVGPLLTNLFDPDPASGFCKGPCPDNVFLVADSQAATTGLTVAVQVVVVAVFAGVGVVVVRRWRSASAAYRRSLRPVLLTAGATLGLYGLQFAVQTASHRGGQIINVGASVAFMTIPLAFLYGLVRVRLAHRGVAQLATELDRAGPGRLTDALRRVLHDPTLVVAYPRREGGGYVTVDGAPVELPPPGPSLTVFGETAAILHDPALHEEPELLASALATARLALENERLQADLASRLQELKAAHARGLEGAVAERRRLERNLHDGAQQRLVSLALTLRMARSALPAGSDTAEALLEAASGELTEALAELRELARGIHPAVLSERGLEAALESLVTRTPLAVDLHGVDGERLPEAVEIAAYYVVAEALTNVAKYAEASDVVVSLQRVDGIARVEIADDGGGGADPDRGSGLRGLADRLALVGGTLDVSSPVGAGTRVVAEIPLG